MSPPTAESEQPPLPSTWQQLLRSAVRDIDELARLLELDTGALRTTAGADFPLLVPRGFVARMRKGDPTDPLLLQVLPRGEEAAAAPGFAGDPLNERMLARDGLIRKYPQRALLITTGACPIHCRYCFRRAFPYDEHAAGPAALSKMLAGSPDVRELILSGGDPLTLADSRLARLLRAAEDAPQITSLRLHTRFPVVLPERIDASLLTLLSRSRLDIDVVVHVNHPNELDATARGALAALRGTVRFLLNQSVLLRGINDDAGVLFELSERLGDCGVLPYYLHLLDRVEGAAHFEVDGRRGVALVEALRRRLPGYLVPRLVREIPGQLSKTPIGRSLDRSEL